MIINEFGRCPTRSDVYFANNKQVSLAVFIVVFCFTHAEHNLIKLKGARSRMRQFLATESPLKIMKNVFLFHLKSSFRSQDI